MENALFVSQKKINFELKLKAIGRKKMKNLTAVSIGVHVKCVNGPHICTAAKEPTSVWKSYR